MRELILSGLDDTGIHCVYPDFFLTEEGKRILSEVYLPLAEDESRSNLDRLGRDDVTKIISSVKIGDIDEEKRREITNASSDWAQEEFKGSFLRVGGDIKKLENPKRVYFLEDPDNFIKRVRELRSIKADIKRQESLLRNSPDNLSQAKLIVLGMYRRLVNIKLARTYAVASALRYKRDLSDSEKEALSLFSLPKRREDEDVVGLDDSGRRVSRFVERIDHFLQGTGLSIGENGLFVSFPDELRSYVLGLIDERRGSDEWNWANGFILSPQQIKSLADVAIDLSGLEGWSARVDKVKGGLKCVYKKGGKLVREIKIPESESRPLGEILVVLEHEISHALRSINRESLEGKTLKIASNLVSGRGGAVNEGVSKWVEDEARKEMFGFSSPVEPYYLLAISKKAEGGDFKECFYTFLEAYARRELGLEISDLIKDNDKFDQAFNYVYPRVLRIFRRNSPLDDGSGYVPDTRQLEYLEGYLTVKVLEEKGLLKYAFIKGLDLNSIPDLQVLGMIDTSSVLEPSFAVARNIWPKIRSYLKEGKGIDEALASLPTLPTLGV